jgi:hypothetical protein
MTEPAVTLTDYALTLECLVFAFLLFGRAGAEGPLALRFAWLFTLLATASLLGGTYHGFFSGVEAGLGAAIWTGTLIAIGLVTFVIWNIAGEIQLGAAGQRVVLVIAVAQLTAFLYLVFFVSKDFLYASAGTAPAMLFLLVGYFVAHRRLRHAAIRLGIIGLLLAFAGAAQQQMKIGIDPHYFNHNAVYHVIQGVAFFLIFRSVAGLTAHRG